MMYTSTYAEWETIEFTLNSDGYLIYEKVMSGDVIRSREWTYVTDGSGNVTGTAGAWSYP